MNKKMKWNEKTFDKIYRKHEIRENVRYTKQHV
jgi:hypothetical protein